MNCLFTSSLLIISILGFFFYKSWKKLLIGFVISILAGVSLGHIAINSLQADFIALYPTRASNPLPLGAEISLPIIVLAITTMVIAFFIVANYRKMAPNVWSATVFCLLFITTGNFIFQLYYNGLSSIIQIFCENNIYICFITSITLLISITILSWFNYRKRQKQSYKFLGYSIGGLYAGALLIFITGYLVAYIYGSIILRNSHITANAPNIAYLYKNTPQGLILYEKALNDFRQKYSYNDVEYPYDGVSYWIKQNNNNILSDKVKANTIKLLDSSDEKVLFDSFEYIFNWEQKNPHQLSSNILNSYMRSMRHITGKSGLYHYTKQYDKILPLLNEIFYKNELSMSNQYFTIKGVVKLVCRARVIYAMVSICPNDQASIPIYSAILKRIEDEKLIKIPEEEFYAQTLNNLLHLNYSNTEIAQYNCKDKIFNIVTNYSRKEFPKTSKLAQLINTPNLIIQTANTLKYYQNLPNYDKLLSLPYEDPNRLWYEKETIQYVQNFYRMRSEAILGLALKIYRCEKGIYPKTLAELVPNYLTKLPWNKDFIYYNLDDVNFSLKLDSRKIDLISSKINY